MKEEEEVERAKKINKAKIFQNNCLNQIHVKD
jgi:hypothetical protein